MTREVKKISGNADLHLNEVERLFLIEQYKTLREEISDIKRRVFRLTTGTTVAVPLISYVANKEPSFLAISLVMPLVVFVLGLNYMSEKSSLMRAGHFIKDHIEKRISNVYGWETWLEDTNLKPKNRKVEIRENMSFSLMFGIYYTLSTFSGIYFLYVFLGTQNYGNMQLPLSALAGALYMIMGYQFIKYLIRNAETSTER